MEFITGKHISRRKMLQGVGAAVGLPLLDAMGSARAAWFLGVALLAGGARNAGRRVQECSLE